METIGSRDFAESGSGRIYGERVAWWGRELVSWGWGGGGEGVTRGRMDGGRNGAIGVVRGGEERRKGRGKGAFGGGVRAL